MSGTLQAIALGGVLAILGPLVGMIAPAIADRIRYGKQSRPEHKK